MQIDKPKISKMARKLRINPKEWYVETQYKNPAVAAFYRYWHQTAGPFIMVPSLSKPIDKEVVSGPFSLFSIDMITFSLVYSSYPIELVKLDEAKHIVVSGEWKKTSAGGSHLHSDEFIKGAGASWQSNPKYLLVLKGEGRASVEIVLSKPQWKATDQKAKDPAKGVSQEIGKKEEKKKAKTIVGTMLGVYIFENRGQKMIKKSDAIEEVTFYPKSEIILSKTLECKEAGYIIMPCTFEVMQALYSYRTSKKGRSCYQSPQTVTSFSKSTEMIK